ncbi:predicted protein [Botrytis cinerea T4]|uniref:Uncharacterized protein n=1 Tax=Botryotinia fuckeliana (strain T4) TaxID=999810 RepID=G2YWN5_BOTF4|nr:predicted protein [Botrytis cinerea T4]
MPVTVPGGQMMKVGKEHVSGNFCSVLYSGTVAQWHEWVRNRGSGFEFSMPRF